MEENIKNYDPHKEFERLKKNTAQVIPEDEFLKKLKSGKRLKIKLGADPTAPDLHLGHVVVLTKLREFQEAGHEVIFLIGDFTAYVGDPTGKSKTRPALTEEEIAKNTTTYFEQVSKILDLKQTTIAFNSSWLDKLSSKDMIRLCAKATLARLTGREDFAQRIKNNQYIGFHELLYPLLQAYDSVELKADVELGGTDQTFNLLFGRFLQEQYGQEPQVIMTVPILEGLDGIEKMSKSLGNYIGLAQPADEVYGKLMSISDKLMWRYMKVLLHNTDDEISLFQERVAAGTTHPMELKKQVAHNIVTAYWSYDEANKAQEKFEALFQKRDYSQAHEIKFPSDSPNPLWIVDLLKLLGSVSTTSQAKRLIEDGAVKCDGISITDFKAQIEWVSGMTVKVGKYHIYLIK